MNAADLNRLGVLRRRLAYLERKIEERSGEWDIREHDALARAVEVFESEEGFDDEDDLGSVLPAGREGSGLN